MNDKIKNYMMVTLTAALLVSVGFNVMPEPTHRCDSKELLAYCFDMSSTSKTCYTLPNKVGGKRCTEGWRDLSIKIDVVDYICDNKKCEILNKK